MVNIRRSPGYVGKPDNDRLGELGYGEAATITGHAQVEDGLVWWRLRATVTSGERVDGFAAESIPGQVLLSTASPLA